MPPSPERRTLIASLLLLAALLAVALIAAAQPAPPAPAPTSIAAAAETAAPAPSPTAASSPTPALPPVTATPGLEERIAALGAPADADAALYARLLASPPPPYDRVQMAIALGRITPADVPAPPTAPARAYQIGDVETFWVRAGEGGSHRQITARLVIISRYAYFWLDTESTAASAGGAAAFDADWRAAAGTFDMSYQAVRAVFGAENAPGIDGDLRLHILHTDALPNAAGYFSAPDTLPAAIYPTSNQREMFYMSLRGSGGVNSPYYNATLAHELQHMIQHHADPDEAQWVNEGLSKLAQHIAGLGGDENVQNYLRAPDRSLWFFGGELQDYGHAYLFIDYLYERFGATLIAALVAQPANSFDGIDAALAALGIDVTADALYADFMAALALNDVTVGDGRYGFRNASFTRLRETEYVDSTPVTLHAEVQQYGIDQVRVRGEGPVRLTFSGAQTVPLLPADAWSGRSVWWSQRSESSAPTLTRAVDLRGVSRATLSFRAWWELEPGWDYAYVLVSTDGGATWTPQVSTSSTDDDPHGSNYGRGLNGMSGAQNPLIGPARWTLETVDLSAYAGQAILLRFTVICDEGLTLGGLALDDIAIPEIGFFDDAETDGDWIAGGFVRIHNRLPQRWALVAVLEGPQGVRVQALPVVNGSAALDVNLDDVERVSLLISGLTRFTAQSAPYRVEVAASSPWAITRPPP